MYSTPKDRKDIGPPPVVLSDAELADYEGLPGDYDKEVHDNMYQTYICECISFVVVHFPERDPLRLAQVYRYKPRRLQTPYFIDAWEDNEREDARELALFHLDMYAKDIKKCAMWRPDPLPLPQDIDITYDPEASNNSTSKIKWSTTHAKSGMFAADDADDNVDDDTDEEDFDSDDVFTDDDDNESD
jgi:hypothetical protein